MLDFVIELFYYITYIISKLITNERAKLSKGSDAKPRVKCFKSHDRRAAEGTEKRLHTICCRGVFF